jgi:hypothetical protein
LFFVLPGLLVILVALLVALPSILKNYVNKHGQEYIGRATTIQELRINYFTSTFSIHNFKMLEADGKSTFASFDTLLVAIKPLPLFTAKLMVEQIRLVKPEVYISMKDSAFNFDDIPAFLDAKAKADTLDQPAEPSEPFGYFLKNISMEGGTLVFEDQTVQHTTQLHNLGFFVPELNFNQDQIRDTGIKFNFANGGSFQAKADYNQKSGSYSADFSVDKLKIAPFLPYAKDYIRLSGMEGLAGGDFHLTGNVNNLDSIVLRGKANVSDFMINDLAGRKVMGARSAIVTMKDSYPMKFDFKFDLIQLTEPYLFVEMKDSTINLLNLMVESTGEETPPVEYAYQIEKFRIERGLLDLRDNTLEAPFDYHLSEISMKVDSITSSAKWLNAYASMRLNKRGKLQAELGINPSDPYELKLNYVITNFQLSDLNIFSTHYVGYPFLLGNMYYKGKTVIANKQLNSENKLIIRNVQLGKKSGGLMDLPLKLALYLLKDLHGDITLDLPVTGDLNDPKTKIGRLVWQVVKNVIVKVVASPFLAIGKMMGVDPTEVKGVEFGYADTTLTSTHLRRIRLFTEMEQKKPDMKIELSYFNDAALEKREIALAEAGKQFYAATGVDYKKDLEKFRLYLGEKLQIDTLSAVSGSLQLIGAHKIDSIQQSITKYRINRIESSLKSFSDSTRIRVAIPNKEVPENVGSRPVFELKYSVED